MAAMGGRRKGDRKGKKVGPKVRPKLDFAAGLRLAEDNLRAQMQDLVIMQMMGKELEGEPPPRVPLSTDNLETILGALQDGVRPGPGQEDLDMLADVVCELIERRKTDGLYMNFEQNQWWGGRQDEEGSWKYDIRTDFEHFVAPDGTVLFSISKLDALRDPARKDSMARAAFQAWRDGRTKRAMQELKEMYHYAEK